MSWAVRLSSARLSSPKSITRIFGALTREVRDFAPDLSSADATDEPVQNVRFGHEHLVEAERPHDGHEDERAAHDDVDAAGLEARVVTPHLGRFGGQRAEHVFGGGPVEP